jgi:hypothetical protein
MRSRIRNTAFFLANWRICGLGHEGNLRICDLLFNHYKFADLRFAERAQEFADLREENCQENCVNSELGTFPACTI